MPHNILLWKVEYLMLGWLWALETGTIFTILEEKNRLLHLDQGPQNLKKVKVTFSNVTYNIIILSHSSGIKWEINNISIGSPKLQLAVLSYLIAINRQWTDIFMQKVYFYSTRWRKHMMHDEW